MSDYNYTIIYKNDWYAAIMIGVLLIAGLVIGLYSLGFMDPEGKVEMRWESPEENFVEQTPENENSTSPPIPDPPGVG